MTLVAFEHVATIADQENLFLTGITDMIVAETDQGSVLYTVSRFGGGDLVAYRINENGTLSQFDTLALPGAARSGTTNSLSLVYDGAGGHDLLVTGVNNTGLYRIEMDAQGALSQPTAVTGAYMPATLLDSTSAVVNGQTYLYSIDRGSDDIGVWRVADNGTVTTVRDGGTGDMGRVGLTGITEVESGGNTYVLAASGSENALISYRLSGSGVPQEVDRISAAEGVGIGGATTVEVIEIGEQAFAILAASVTGTLTVAMVADDGSLQLTDHVMDTLDTRFGGVHEIATVTHNDRGYVAVAGDDDGVSLFEMMSDGRLRLMGSLADTMTTTLDAVSALNLTVVNGVLHLTVGSATEAGLSVFTIDISAMNSPLHGNGAANDLTGNGGADLIMGGGGNDSLYGAAGNDVLLDGDGSDALWGGAGADVFVMSGDDALDTIHDFDITEDRLDLSDWAFLRGTGQLSFQTLNNGIIILFGTEELVLLSASGARIEAEDILALDILGQSRFLPDWFPPAVEPDPNPDPGAPLDLRGTNGRDTLSGNAGNDTIRGLSDADNLSGMGGADTLSGDSGNDTIAGNAGNDSLRGGDGNDSLTGGTGFDTLLGDGGDDNISGAGGDDMIEGGVGRDTLSGNAGNDVISGFGDADVITGGIGFDTLNGQDGDDSIWGNDGFDVIGGGGGNDLLVGNNGADTLNGNNGDDTLSGGLANDFLTGGNGNDVILGAAGPDELRGDAGNDVLDGNAGFDLLLGGRDDDTLNGGINHDTLYGGTGNDRLNGNNGQDQLFGEDGNDTLLGNAGPDTLDGGLGDDLLLGGIGADTFVFSSGSDTVGDFQDEIDTLVLDSALWGGGARSLSQLSAYAEMTESGIQFDFGNGHILTLTGVTDLNILHNDLDFI